ncbi:hypothetical protein UFOVP97_44 [uncultured Caudovirales phage]|uniref:Uncharacterized protein n=1 Tax=uncultured Caudovirales phage TaxID=2100421 RepID=A0A6J5LM09_9CAUD|nr:hypothetical protein UFOVP97_44 [uncultured Caudovirales phage]CAB4134020.1 hypothetical protein UFOVP268_6 [uncultured Caudovirales phage]
MDAIQLLQGNFTATGNVITLPIPSFANWMYVYNMTASAQTATTLNTAFYWQLGMAPNDGIVYQKSNAGTFPITMYTLASQGTQGFTLLDQNSISYDPYATPLVGPAVAFASISNAVQPIVATGSTAGLSVGSVVRLSMTNAQFAANPSNVLGMDFQIDTIVANTSFRFAEILSQAPGAVGGAGTWRIVNINSIFYPKTRYIINITQAVNAVVTTSVNHGYVPGQEVRFNIVNPLNGMTQLNQQVGTVTAVTASTFTVNINTTGYTAFQFPTVAQLVANGPYTFASVDPVGQDTAYSLANNLNTLADATVNQAVIGMQLGGGAGAGTNAGPAGATGDSMFWVSGTSYSTSIIPVPNNLVL